MQADWQNFLQRQGAVIEQCAVQRFDPPHAPSGANAELCDLSPLGLISVRGDDAAAFLQAQLSNDLTQLAQGAAPLAAYLSPQGRVLALTRVLRHGDAIHLLLPEELRESIHARLQRYVLRAAVTLGSDNERFARLGLSGTGARDLITGAGLPLPGRDNTTAADEHCRILALDTAAGRYVLLVPYQRAAQLWSRWAPHAGAAPYGRWRLADIEAGVAAVFAATSDAFVAQMVNLDLVGALSFDKGCYPGQEIVARTHYLGRIKRRMQRLRAPAGHPALSPGEDLVRADDSPAGTTVDAAADTDGSQQLLAVVANSAADAELYHLRAGGPALQRLDLPYAVSFSE